MTALHLSSRCSNFSWRQSCISRCSSSSRSTVAWARCEPAERPRCVPERPPFSPLQILSYIYICICIYIYICIYMYMYIYISYPSNGESVGKIWLKWENMIVVLSQISGFAEIWSLKFSTLLDLTVRLSFFFANRLWENMVGLKEYRPMKDIRSQTSRWRMFNHGKIRHSRCNNLTSLNFTTLPD